MGEFVIKEGVKEPKVRKKHHGWKIFLGWFGGFIAGIGLLVGGAFLALSVIKASQIVQMIGLNPSDILGENFQNTSIMGLITHVTNTKFNTLEDINYVTPMVEKLIVETINPVLDSKLHFTVDWEEIKSVPFKSDNPDEEILGEYLERTMMENIKLINFIENPEDLKNIYNYFFYDVARDADGNVIYDSEGNVTINKDDPFSLKDYMSGMSLFDGILDYIKIGDVMTVTESSSELIKTIAKWKISEVQDKFDTLTIGDLFTDEEIAANNLLNAVQDWTISDLSDPTNFDALTIGDIVDVTDPSVSAILVRIQDVTVGELKTGAFVDSLHLSDIFGSDPTGVAFLDVLITKDYTVSDLSDPDKIMGITIEEIFPDLTSDDLLYNFKTYTLEEMSDLDTSELKVTDVFSQGYIDSNSFLSAAIANNPDVTIGQLLDYNQTISHIQLDELLPSSMFSNNILNAIKGYEIGSLGTAVNSLTLADIITIESGEEDTIKGKIVTALGSYTITEVGDHFEDLTIGDIVTIDSSSPAVLKSIQNTALTDLEDKLSSLTVADVIDIAPGSALDVEAIKNASITTTDFMGVLTANLTLGAIMDIPTDAPKILRTLRNVVIDDIYETIMGDGVNPGLTLGDMIDIDSSSPQILQSLAGAHLFGDSADLETQITNLKFNQVYTYDPSWSTLMKTLWGDPTTGGDFLISELDTRVSNLKLVDLLEADMYEADGVHIKSTWWLLLKPEGENLNVEKTKANLGAGANYKIGDFGVLVTNLNYHMQNESLFTLIDAEFITVDSDKQAKLYEVITYKGENQRVGDLTISDFINYCLTLIPNS